MGWFGWAARLAQLHWEREGTERGQEATVTQEEGQAAALTMRIKTERWESLKRAHDIVFGEALYLDKESGLLSAKVYRNSSDANDLLFVSEWRSESDIQKFATRGQSAPGSEGCPRRFNEVAGTRSDEGEDTVWLLADEMAPDS